jgi:hypothetical protein
VLIYQAIFNWQLNDQCKLDLGQHPLQKTTKPSSQSWTQMNSSHSADSKNEWSITSTPWWLNYIEPTLILNRTVFCFTVPCSSKMVRRFGGTYHLDCSTWHMLVCCFLLCIVYNPEDRGDVLPKAQAFSQVHSIATRRPYAPAIGPRPHQGNWQPQFP